MKGLVPILELALLHLYHPCNYVLMRMAASPLWYSPDHTAKPRRLTPPFQAKSMHRRTHGLTAYFSCTSCVAFSGEDNMKPNFLSHRFMPRLILPVVAGACLITPFCMFHDIGHKSHRERTRGTLPERTTRRDSVPRFNHTHTQAGLRKPQRLTLPLVYCFDVDVYFGSGG